LPTLEKALNLPAPFHSEVETRPVGTQTSLTVIVGVLSFIRLFAGNPLKPTHSRDEKKKRMRWN
jgi:hypothetical protein